MNALNALGPTFLPWLIVTSLQASLLIVLILVILRLLGGKLDPRWQYGLWVLVLVRMMLPWAPVAPWSVHNALTPVVAWASGPGEASSATDGYAVASLAGGNPEAEESATGAGEPAVGGRERPSAGASLDSYGLPFYRQKWFLPGVWLAGLAVIGASLLWNQLTLWRAVTGRRPSTDGALLDLLEDCKARMGVNTFLAIVPTDQLRTPALYGLVRPRLLIPAALLEQLSREQLRHVLLHELAHLKRLDIHLSWVTAILQTLHWFNPLMWVAAARLRVARELACDQKVLAVLDQQEARAYGDTVLNLLEYWTRPRRIPGMAGILEERSQLKRRITMIANYRARAGMGSLAGLTLATGLILVGLTNGQVVPPGSGEKSAGAAKAPAAPEIMLRYDDDQSSGKLSVATSGHGIEFKRPAKARFVEAVDIFASRYGTDQAPKEFFHLYVLNADRQVLADVPFAYGLIQKGEEKWYRLRTPSVEVPETFMIALSFDPHQTKGIYLHSHDTDKPHSFLGLPDDGYVPVEKKYDWMVRVAMADVPSGQKGTRLLKDWKPPKKAGPFGSCIAIPSRVELSPDKQSYGGRGPAIEFTVNPARVGSGSLSRDEIMVKGFSLYASRYGAGYDPLSTMVDVVVLDSTKEVRWQGKVAYGAFAFTPKWVNVVLPKPMRLSDLAGEDNKLVLAFDPDARQNRGIYFHYQKNPEQSHSLAGTVNGGFSPVSDREWLMRVYVQPKGAAAEPKKAEPAGKS